MIRYRSRTTSGFLSVGDYNLNDMPFWIIVVFAYNTVETIVSYLALGLLAINRFKRKEEKKDNEA